MPGGGPVGGMDADQKEEQKRYVILTCLITNYDVAINQTNGRCKTSYPWTNINT
jgi:hypothetical protein